MQQNRTDTLRRRIELYRRLLSKGVDTDLRVRPFFAHGGRYSIREFVMGALRDEMGLQAVDRSSPFFGLKGTDNQVAFTTARYRKNPLVITGPGAGPAVTAAGVLNDMLHAGA